MANSPWRSRLLVGGGRPWTMPWESACLGRSEAPPQQPEGTMLKGHLLNTDRDLALCLGSPPADNCPGPEKSPGVPLNIPEKASSEDPQAKANSFTPRPPPRPRLERALSLDEKGWRRRRFQTSREDLAAQNGASPSGGSLQAAALGTPAHTCSPPCLSSSWQEIPASHGAAASAASAGERPSSWGNCVSLHPLQRDGARAQSAPGLASRLPTRPLPAMDWSVASDSLRTANKVDADYRRRLQAALSRPPSPLACDSGSLRSAKSAFSLLAPIRAKDVRGRWDLWGAGGIRGPHLRVQEPAPPDGGVIKVDTEAGLRHLSHPASRRDTLPEAVLRVPASTSPARAWEAGRVGGDTVASSLCSCCLFLSLVSS